MARIGYQRVSTQEQNLARQDLGQVEKLFSDKASGATTERPALKELLSYVRKGDEVVCFSIDRLARSLGDLQGIISAITDKGASVAFLSERLTFSCDKDDAFSTLQLQMMGAFAQFERTLILNRQAEGIAKAKEADKGKPLAERKFKGRKPSIKADEVARLREQGLGATAIAEALGISRASVYRF
ncbi:MAG: recombinase family protein [Rhodobacteraceae bacterium]|nr:recombinase family protein [Paracoccaceae bacterium]